MPAPASGKPGQAAVSEEAETSPVKEAALAMLGRRSQSAAGLREKLRRKFPDEDGHEHAGQGEIERVIARFAELGLLDDQAYAESFARDRFLRGGYGRRRIAQDLERKGVDSADAAAAIERVVDDDTERQMAERALERFRTRKARSGSPPDPRKLREAAFRHLISRGFEVSLVRDLLAVS